MTTDSFKAKFLEDFNIKFNEIHLRDSTVIIDEAQHLYLNKFESFWTDIKNWSEQYNIKFILLALFDGNISKLYSSPLILRDKVLNLGFLRLNQ